MCFYHVIVRYFCFLADYLIKFAHQLYKIFTYIIHYAYEKFQDFGAIYY